MQVIFVDIWNEVLDVRREAIHLSIALARKTDGLTFGEQETWERTHMLGSAIEKIYTGCERVMDLLASNIDGAPVNHSEGWHVALLKRLAHPVPNVREAVISPDCCARLDRLRAFRHRVRNSYGIDLDPAIVLDRAHEAVETLKNFETEIKDFLLKRDFDPVVTNHDGSRSKL
jgi:hypothetical protein